MNLIAEMNPATLLAEAKVAEAAYVQVATKVDSMRPDDPNRREVFCDMLRRKLILSGYMDEIERRNAVAAAVEAVFVGLEP